MEKRTVESLYTYLRTLQTSQIFLKKCYRDLPNSDANAKSFENSGTFMYYLDHGSIFLTEGEHADIRLKPMLYFYGLVHLLKACLLTNRPDYPESTAVLAHGVTARKRKKKNYSFTGDEVKIQQNGLFCYAYNHLFHAETPPFQKINMNLLLGLIPEMNDFYSYRKEVKSISIGKKGATNITFPLHLLDSYHLTKTAFIQRLRIYLPAMLDIKTSNDRLHIKLEKPLQHITGPFYVHLDKQEIYFPCSRDYYLSINEIMVHYLLLYNLSMISRYETEYWGELISTKSEQDYAIISHYVNIAAEKIYFLIGEWLYERAPETE
ncbi:YaaC family protein [Virgibacillus sp. NKC19-3]|uniref:YaaC family protein n=1 Tax=Virgibacillus saliphilus TaxID=2831674 RepID=UPI001C9B1CA2|nr:YaaC family protein [Virgibacillus sp. NKC19-3]MBY7141523.1 YaaC family protein [Virgibacillus sp. NKC19-3]